MNMFNVEVNVGQGPSGTSSFSTPMRSVTAGATPLGYVYLVLFGCVSPNP